MTVGKLQDRHIVITRPPGQASRLSRLIVAQAGIAHLFPLIEIVPLEDYTAFDGVIAALEDYDWAIFISSNAVEHAMPRLLARSAGMPSGLRFAAIGPVTATSLAGYGVTQTLTPSQRFDSEALLALPEMQAVAGRKILIFRGVGGREVLAETLRARGASVTFAECYRRINPQRNADSLQQLWQNGSLDAIVVTTSEAMRHLLALAGDNAPWLAATPLCVNHARIGELASSYGLTTAVADAPGDDAMLACLIRTMDHPKDR
ncbi:MAG TPA: uroporphyrinogen-III synthase [Methylophilaceae bacterium]|nr:uroporphyrinogen-III synthase [Methylophilaceae bacterium]